MSIAQIQQSMEMNRGTFEQGADEIRVNAWLSPLQRRRLLAQLWVDAMRAHYHLLEEYLTLRDLTCTSAGTAIARLQPWQLRAPARPTELPESLSRYVTVTHHAEHLI